MGIGLTHTSPAATPQHQAERRALLVIPLWWRTAPLGKPVVPEVYWIWAGSSGRTSGNRSVAEPEAQNAGQSENRTTSRKSGSRGRTVSRNPTRELPRYSGTRTSPAARDWR